MTSLSSYLKRGTLHDDIIFCWESVLSRDSLVIKILVGSVGQIFRISVFWDEKENKKIADDGSGASSFDGWSWPIIESEDIDANPQHVFDLLVKEQDDGDIQGILIEGIRSAWTASKHGVFIGSLYFDKVGDNPYSGYDAVESLTRVIDEVGISAKDVIVIVTYGTSRVNQWGVIWENHFDADSYEDFVCSNEQSDKR